MLDEAMYNKIVGLFVEIQIEIAHDRSVHLLRALLYEVLALLQRAVPVESDVPVSVESRVVRFQELVNEYFAIETGASEPIGYVNAENYKQHNLTIADGLDGLGAALAPMAEQGIKMEYFKIHKIFGCGNFVLAVSEGAFANQPTSY